MQFVGGHAADSRAAENLSQTLDPFFTGGIACEQRAELREHLVAAAADFSELQHLFGLFRRRCSRGHHFCRHSFAANFSEFVEREGSYNSLAQIQLREQAAKDLPVVHANREVIKTNRPHQFVNDDGRFNVGRDTLRADGVEVALHEFAVPAAL